MIFSSGDVVRLKSGGPKMTVLESTDTQDTVDCQWFDRNGKLQQSSFQPQMIEIFIPRPRD